MFIIRTYVKYGQRCFVCPICGWPSAANPPEGVQAMCWKCLREPLWSLLKETYRTDIQANATMRAFLK